jgi:signal transduction histidine kinase
MSEGKINLQRQPVDVDADVVRMAQVVLNLLNNAGKYTPEVGRICLTAGKEGGEAVIRVRDAGMGIPADMVPKVLDLFIQAERTLDQAKRGGWASI